MINRFQPDPITAGGGGGIAFVQGKTFICTSGCDPQTVTFDNDTVSGNAIVAKACDTGENYDDPPTDTKGNFYHNYANSAGGSSELVIAISTNITGGASHGVTFNPTGTGAQQSIIISEVSGVQQNTTARDGTNTNTGTSSSATPGSITSTAASIFFAFMCHETGGSPTITEPGSGWVLIGENENTANVPCSGIYKIEAGAATNNPAWTIGSAVTWRAAQIALK